MILEIFVTISSPKIQKHKNDVRAGTLSEAASGLYVKHLSMKMILV